MRRASGLTPEFHYDDRAGRYTDARSGRFVSQARVREALDQALDNGGKQIQKLAGDLREGRLSLAEWQLGMAREIKSIHLASYSLASGGWSQLSQADYGRIGAFVKADYQALRGFAEQIASGEQLLDGTLARRADLYAQAGRRTYHAVERRDQELRGMTEERSVRSPADSCDECISEEAAGWRPIGEMIPLGARQCLTRCRCRAEFRQGE